MEEKDLKHFIKSLEGISYSEWIKLKIAIDRSFKNHISELERTIQLTNTKEIEKLIQSQFE